MEEVAGGHQQEARPLVAVVGAEEEGAVEEVAEEGAVVEVMVAGRSRHPLCARESRLS